MTPSLQVDPAALAALSKDVADETAALQYQELLGTREPNTAIHLLYVARRMVQCGVWNLEDGVYCKCLPEGKMVYSVEGSAEGSPEFIIQVVDGVKLKRDPTVDWRQVSEGRQDDWKWLQNRGG